MGKTVNYSRDDVQSASQIAWLSDICWGGTDGLADNPPPNPFMVALHHERRLSDYQLHLSLAQS